MGRNVQRDVERKNWRAEGLLRAQQRWRFRCDAQAPSGDLRWV